MNVSSAAVQEMVHTFHERVADGDRADAQSLEWCIWHDALQLIARGEGNPTELAKSALQTLEASGLRRLALAADPQLSRSTWTDRYL